MSIRTFTSNLKKILDRRLPQSTEYGWSKRVEGALVRSEDSAAHETGAIIIDDALTEEQSQQLCEVISDYLSKDPNFKRTKYKVMIWRESAFSVIHEHGPTALCNIKGLKTDLGSVKTTGNDSGDWDAFRELYIPHKKAGQVILLTTQEKIDLLEQAGTIIIKNLVIAYPHTDGKERKAIIKDSLTLGLNALTLTDVTKNAAYGVEIESLVLEINAPAA